ncbi:Major facilitator superfamily MFS_1 [Elusimicrobium minutum Pei191]|uniref:Major facilitator superfamily MFS_1 n=1 Tax=Elusimicrobium minutum (strain Pei191) TaxID=445932 RepID=B2KBE9_ELUMP|nr:MFS transporter [Elusimicrobium minutum]ACC97971.1 Major facilitator superfamily MFS_1 [Elusimicrobium minutum Pei191]
MLALDSVAGRLRGSKKVIAWLVAVAFFMQMLDGTILNTALPEIAKSFGENPLRMQSVVISYMLTVAFILPISGWLADFLGTKRVFISAIFIFSLGSLCCALSNTLTQLVLSRVLQGVGGALMVPVGRLAVMRIFPKKELVSALSFITIPALVGPIVGPFAGGVIVQYVSWHWIFLINLPIGVVCAVFTYIAMPKVTPVKFKFDWIGYLLFSAAVILISLSLGSVDEATLGRRAAVLMFLAGALCLGAYARLSIAKPWSALFKPRLFYERSFTVGIIANLFIRFAGGSLPFLAPLFLQTALNYSPLKAGVAMLPLGVMSIAAKTFVEPVLNKLGYRRLMTYNAIIIGIMLCFLAFIGPNTSYLFILVYLGVLGIFNSMQFTSLNTLTLIAVPPRDLSQANSLLSAVMQISMGLGVSLVSAALAYFGAHTAKIGSENILYSFHATFVFIGVISILGVILFQSKFARGIVDKPKNM